MPKRIELLPKAEIGRAYAILDGDRVEIHVSGVMGALKAWLVGGKSTPIGNIVGGRLIRTADISSHSGILITQSGRQMFYGGWEEESETHDDASAKPQTETSSVVMPEPKDAECPEDNQENQDSPEPSFAPLPDYGWQKITGRSFPSMDERVRFALSTRAFFEAFKKQGYYLFGRDGERFALAIRREEGENPFPNLPDASFAGEYAYVVL